jgi:hypothetical protein
MNSIGINVNKFKKQPYCTTSYRNALDKVEQERRKKAIQEYINIARPLLKNLEEIGFKTRTISDLCYLKQGDYKKVVPILLYWLPKIKEPRIKEDIVRTLSMPWAKPIAAKTLIEEFKTTPNKTASSLKWAIGNGLSIVADDSVFKEIVNLIKNKKNGKSREMLALALGNMSTPQAISVLINLLKDEEVAGHAIMGLRKLNAIKARPFLDNFLNHPKLWIRNQAKKTIAKFDKLTNSE